MSNKPTLTVASVIRAARQRQGLGVRELAALVGVNPSQALRWESGEREPSAQYLVSLAKHLDVRAADLFALSGVPLPDELISLPALLRSEYELPPDAVAEVEQAVARIAKKYRRTDDSSPTTHE